MDSPKVSESSLSIRCNSVDHPNQDAASGQINPRPRCNTDPGWSRRQQSSTGGGALTSLLRQTLTVTSASVGIAAKRRSPLRHSARLSNDARYKDARSQSSPRKVLHERTSKKSQCQYSSLCRLYG